MKQNDVYHNFKCLVSDKNFKKEKKLWKKIKDNNESSLQEIWH